LVWTGDRAATQAPAPPAPPDAPPPVIQAGAPPQVASPLTTPRPPEAERRQLTVLFCDLVDSTALASQLDPEEWREVVRAYQDTCAKVIAPLEGHFAQSPGAGRLVCRGYPLAQEDDAPGAGRAGGGRAEALRHLNSRLKRGGGVELAVRLGIHPGLVVGGEVGGDTRHQQ